MKALTATKWGLVLSITLLAIGFVGAGSKFVWNARSAPDAGAPALDDGEEGLTVAANVSSAIGKFEPGATYKVRCGAPFYLRVGKGWPAATARDMWMSRIGWHHIRLGPSDTTLAFLLHEATKCEVRLVERREPADAGVPGFTESLAGWEKQGYPVGPDGSPLDPHDALRIDGPSKMWMWGAQAEFGTGGATSYVPSNVHTAQPLPRAEGDDLPGPPAADAGLGWRWHERMLTISIWALEQTEADGPKVEALLDCWAMRGYDRAMAGDCGGDK